jgi:hypothetical protein
MLVTLILASALLHGPNEDPESKYLGAKRKSLSKGGFAKWRWGRSGVKRELEMIPQHHCTGADAATMLAK